MAAYIKNPDTKENITLRSIKFKLDNVATLKRNSFIMQVKLFGIKDGLVEQYSLNKKPIYLSSDNISKHNEIFIKEEIGIPAEGFLVSFELPSFFDSKPEIPIEFVGSWSADNCETFIIRNNKDGWDEHLLLKQCRGDALMQKSFRLNINITYQK
jgi:hypothetical protein